MRRMPWICLGVALLAGALAQRGAAQSPGDYSAPVVDHFQSAHRGTCNRDQCDESLDQRFQAWVFGLRPAVRRELMSNLLIGVHPLMAFVPTEGFAELPCDHPATCDPCQSSPHVVQVIAPVESRRDAQAIAFMSFGCFPEVDRPSRVISFNGDACPYLGTQRVTVVVPCFEPPDVMTNLHRLLQADQLIKHGQELARAGQFYEAVDCFQEVQRLVPGTNLEARAGAATQDVLVRVYGTETEKGLVDEQSEPEQFASQPSSPPACPRCAECAARPCAKSEPSAACCESHGKMRTSVYAVADLLGKGGKETKLDDLDELVNVIVSTVEPQSWVDQGGPGNIEHYLRSRALVVRQTPEVHEQIADLLAALRRAKEAGEHDQPKPVAAPVARHADAEEGCCEECCEECCDDCCGDEYFEGCCPEVACHDNTPAAARLCTLDRESCPVPVLTLAKMPAPEDGVGCCLELVCEEKGVQADGLSAVPAGFQWAMFGACAESCPVPDGMRVRWQVPVGPFTLLVEYDRHQLNIELGVGGDGFAVEESEIPH